MPKDHSLQKATDITLSSSGEVFKDRVGKKDLTDLYTFSVGKSSSFELSMTGLSDNADIELYQRNESGSKKSFNKIKKREFSDLFTKPFSKSLKLTSKYQKHFNKSLTRLAISKKGNKKDESIIRELEAGEYFIRVRPSKGGSKKNKIKYTLEVSGTEIGSTPALTPTATPPSTAKPTEPSDTDTTSNPGSGTTSNPGSGTTSNTGSGTTSSTGSGTTSNTGSGTTSNTGSGTTPTVPTPIADGNDTFQAALGITLDETVKTYSNSDLQNLPSGADAFSISNSDKEDYFSFTLASRSQVDLAIGGLTADLDLDLLDSTNTQIIRSEKEGNANEAISEILDAGDYYVRVFQTTEDNETSYTLTGSALSRDDNDTPETADALPFLSFRSSIFDNNHADFADKPFSIDPSDPVDYFSFNLSRASEIRFKLTDLAGDLDMSILNADGTETQLAPQNPGSGQADEVITPAENFSTDLLAGSYLLKIEAADAGVTSKNYTLDLAAIPEQADDFETGDTPGEARTFPEYALDKLDTTSFSNSVRFGEDEALWVGGEDPEDFYKIVLDEKSYISIELEDVVNESINQDSNLDVQLLRQTSADPLTTETVVTSARPGDLAEVVGGQLDAGTYYIRVYPNDPAVDGSFYKMDLALFSLNDVPALTLDIAPGNDDGVKAGEMVSIGTDVYFVANDGDGEAIWISSGASTNTNDVTTEKVDFANPQDFGTITNLSVVNNQLYFLGTVDGVQALWTQDSSGLKQLTGANGTNASATDLLFGINSQPNFTVVDSTLYFFAGTLSDQSEMQGSELWAVNGDIVTLETNVIEDNSVEALLFTQLNGLTVVDDVLYFTKDGGEGRDLYRYDPSGTTDIDTAATSLDTSGSPENLTAVGDTLYFTVDTTLKRIQKDQTAPGDIENIATSETITEFGDETFISVTAPDDSEALYFTAKSSINGRLQTELWYVDQSGTVDTAARITDLAGTESPQPEELTVIDDTLFFAAQDANRDRELWSLNINPADTDNFHTASLVKDINTVAPSGVTVTNSSSLENFIAIDGTLYFAADNGVNGKELWKSDGTADGTQLVYDIQLPVEETETFTNDQGVEETITTTTNGGSAPGDFINVGNRLFFTAEGTLADASAVDGRQKLGRELWALGLKDEG